MSAPQNIRVPGFYFNYFCIEFFSKKTIHEENHITFVDSILPTFKECFGNNFTLTIYIEKNKVDMIIHFSEYMWMNQFAEMTSIFQTKLDDIIAAPITIQTSNNNTSNNIHKTNYNIVCNGEYIKKTKNTCIQTIKTIDDNSWCHGAQVPVYKFNNIDF